MEQPLGARSFPVSRQHPDHRRRDGDRCQSIRGRGERGWYDANQRRHALHRPDHFTADAISARHQRRVQSGVCGRRSVTGAGTLAYQWRRTSGDVAGATSTAITIPNAQPSDSDSYYVRAIYGPGSAFIDSGSTSLNVSSTALQLQPTNLVVARVGDGAQTLRDAGNSMFLDQFTTSGTYINTVVIPDSGTNALIARGSNGANISSLGGMTALTRPENGQFLVLNGYYTNYDPNATLVLGGGTAGDQAIPRAVATLDPLAQFVIRAQAVYPDIAANAFRCAASDGVDEYWGATGGANIPVYYFGTETTPGAIQISNGNARMVNLFNGKFYACLANEGLFRFDGKPHPGDSFTLDIAYSTGAANGGSGSCDFSVSPDGNTIYIADGRNWGSMVINTNGGIQVFTNNGSGGYPISRVLKPDPNGTAGALYVTVDYSQLNPVVYATTCVASQNELVMIVDDGSNGGAGTTTVLATAGPNQEFRGVRFGPGIVSVLRPHIDAINLLPDGNIALTVSGSPNIAYSVQASDAVVPTSWTSLVTNSNPTGTFQYNDLTATNAAHRSIRAYKP